MGLCARLNSPRPEALTPLEFLPRLIDLFPNQTAELQVITAAYQTVRYGELAETTLDLPAIENAWKQVRQAGQVLLTYRQQVNRKNRTP
jgi:hypothetical protein